MRNYFPRIFALALLIAAGCSFGQNYKFQYFGSIQDSTGCLRMDWKFGYALVGDSMEVNQQKHSSSIGEGFDDALQLNCERVVRGKYNTVYDDHIWRTDCRNSEPWVGEPYTLTMWRTTADTSHSNFYKTLIVRDHESQFAVFFVSACAGWATQVHFRGDELPVLEMVTSMVLAIPTSWALNRLYYAIIGAKKIPVTVYVN
jgi:hypothetical protein